MTNAIKARSSMNLLETHEADLSKQTFADIFSMAYSLLKAFHLPAPEIVPLYRWIARAK
jgi:hypothetical protein